MPRETTQWDFCLPITKALKEFGYPFAKNEWIVEALQAWLDGKRGADLPHGVIGMMAARQFEEIEVCDICGEKWI